MKVVICTLYIIMFLIYLVLGDSTRYWGSFNIITQLLFMACTMQWVIFRKKNTKCEKLFLSYVFWITIVRTIYTLICTFASRNWVIVNTDIFTLFVAVSFSTLLIYAVTKYKNEFAN